SHLGRRLWSLSGGEYTAIARHREALGPLEEDAEPLSVLLDAGHLDAETGQVEDDVELVAGTLRVIAGAHLAHLLGADDQPPLGERTVDAAELDQRAGRVAVDPVVAVGLAPERPVPPDHHLGAVGTLLPGDLLDHGGRRAGIAGGRSGARDGRRRCRCSG